jgi:hypothetical protein
MEFKDFNGFGVFEVKKIGLVLFPEKQDYIRCANRTEIVNLFIESGVTFEACKAALNNKTVSPKVAPAIKEKIEPVKVIPVVEPAKVIEPEPVKEIVEVIQPVQPMSMPEISAIIEATPEPSVMPNIESPVIETIQPLPAKSDIDTIRDILLAGFKPVEQVPSISMVDVEKLIDIKLQEFEVRQKLQFTEMLKTMLAVIQ